MENNFGKSYGTCQFCGGKKVLNPKTGKIFCENKCWLKKEERATESNPAIMEQINVNFRKITARIEEIEARLSALELNVDLNEKNKTEKDNIPF